MGECFSKAENWKSNDIILKNVLFEYHRAHLYSKCLEIKRKQKNAYFLGNFVKLADIEPAFALAKIDITMYIKLPKSCQGHVKLCRIVLACDAFSVSI